MLSQKKFYCQEKKKTVEALVDTKGKESCIMNCNDMLFCDGTTFCRFVNPLTTRNPLCEVDEVSADTVKA